MADLTRTGLLAQAADHFAAQGWSETDLSLFRMADEPADEDQPDDDDDDKGSDSPTASADDVEAMKKALKKANREAEQARLKLKEIEDAGKSETQRITEERDSLKGELTGAQATALRFEIALDKGIPKSIAQRLQGATREEMEADAEALLKEIGAGNRQRSFDGGAKDKDAPGSGSFLTQAIRDRRSA